MRRRVALVIATLWLAACARVGSDPGPVCPLVVEYGREFQARAAAEVGALSERAAPLTMMRNYAVMRAQALARWSSEVGPWRSVAQVGDGR